MQEAMYEELVRSPDVIKSIEARLQRAQARWILTKLEICDQPLVCDFPSIRNAVPDATIPLFLSLSLSLILSPTPSPSLALSM